MSEIESFTEIVMAVSAIGVPIVIVWYYLRSKREIQQEQVAKTAVQEMNLVLFAA